MSEKDALSIKELTDKPEESEESGKKLTGRRRQKQEEFNYPVEPRTILVVKKPRTIMNHSYRDFSCVPAELDWEPPESAEKMSFSEKVFDILTVEHYEKVISWMPHGRSFRVHIPKIFEEQICSKYFGHSRYSSFLRQLNNFGFKHITRGSDRNCYYHECFLRGMPHLLRYMPKHRNARRLTPDPESEPDLKRISEHFPLPSDVPKENACEEPSVVTARPHETVVTPTNAASKAAELRANRLVAGAQGLNAPSLNPFPAGSASYGLGSATTSLGRGLPLPTLQNSSSLELALRRQQLLEKLQQQQQQQQTTHNLLNAAAALNFSGVFGNPSAKPW